MRTLYLDIETIPTQQQAFRDEIAQKFLAHHQPRHDEKIAEAAAVKPPGNMTKPETIAAWEKDQKPAKVAALQAEAAGELEQAKTKTEEEWRRTSFDGALGQVVVIGFALDDRGPQAIFERDPKKVLTLDAENRALREFFQSLELVDRNDRHTLQVVGHNVVDFDLRFLWQRAVIHGIKVPYWMPWDAKPWGDRVFDTMMAWTGGKGRISQDKLCRVLGIEGKGSEIGDEIDGSKVWDFVQAGRIAEVATYCAGDVHRAREMHRRMAFTQRAAA